MQATNAWGKAIQTPPIDLSPSRPEISRGFVGLRSHPTSSFVTHFSSMTDQGQVLAHAFGSRVAEGEAEGLKSYFVETEQWRKIFAGEVHVVFGAKESGQGAVYSSLVGNEGVIQLSRRIQFVSAENPRNTQPSATWLQTQPVSPDSSACRATYRLPPGQGAHTVRPPQ